MAEKRFYKFTNGKFTAYYAGHGLDKARLDAAKQAGAFPGDIKHTTMKGSDFYEELEQVEQNHKVEPGKVRGVGQRWIVGEEEEEEEEDESEVKRYYERQDAYISRQLENEENTGGPIHTVKTESGELTPPAFQEDKYKTDELLTPEELEQIRRDAEAELERLRRDPNTYDREIEARGSYVQI